MDTILFDLDGTLLPMDMEKFMATYMGLLGKKCAEQGYDAEKSIAAVWKGTRAMTQNNGAKTNETCFWEVFSAELEGDMNALGDALERFYEVEFHGAQVATQPNPLAAPLVRGLHSKGYTLALATNPLFPLSAIRTRLSWLGLEADDFDLITTYDNMHFSKPNPAYYAEIAQKLGKRPQQCLMVGNDLRDDAPAVAAGMDFYLVTDDLLNGEGQDISAYQHGSFAQCSDYLLDLNSL